MNIIKWTFGIHLFLGVYLLFIASSSLLVGIHLSKQGDKWLIDSFEFPTWAEHVGLHIGDEVLEINGKELSENDELLKNNKIVTAKTILVRQNDTNKQINAKDSYLSRQFILHEIVPLCYFVLTMFIVFVMYKNHAINEGNWLLVLFLMAVSMAYVSGSASSKYDLIGLTVNSTTIVLSFVFLVQFLNTYLKIKLTIFITKTLYSMAFLVVISNIHYYFYEVFYEISSIIILISVVVLLVVIFIQLFIGIKIRKDTKAKYIIYAILIPFMPFVLFYLVPVLLFDTQLMDADIALLFILITPFTFLILTKALFDIQYYINKLQYYSVLSFAAALCQSIIAMLVFGFSWQLFGVLLILFFVFLMVGMFFKEYTDFHTRRVLFTTKGHTIQNLYTSVFKMSQALSKEQLLHIVKQEIETTLGINHISLVIDEDHYMENHPIAKMIKNDTSYSMYIYNVPNLNITLHIHSPIGRDKVLWLELMGVYVNMFIYSLEKIGDLLAQIESLRSNEQYESHWLDMVVWQNVEKEKRILAQELHDTILQDQIQVARQLESLMSNNVLSIQGIELIREQILDINYELRSYCENLSPPLLDTLGLNEALDTFFKKVKMQANFLLKAEIESMKLKPGDAPLMIYRIVQELCHNALKHSEANYVSIYVGQKDNLCTIRYEDDGIGLDLDHVMQSSNSMGLRGIRERVKAMQGDLKVETSNQNGLKVVITLYEYTKD
ncbi:sensor histidine kinase [Lysinibacillus sp. 54212]|uniref:sensor histidine kinase n=1 Tax=Lysinibacillus sp. 54212 TaxID=3119829 RepID=UPI002FCC78A2